MIEKIGEWESLGKFLIVKRVDEDKSFFDEEVKLCKGKVIKSSRKELAISDYIVYLEKNVFSITSEVEGGKGEVLDCVSFHDVILVKKRQSTTNLNLIEEYKGLEDKW